MEVQVQTTQAGAHLTTVRVGLNGARTLELGDYWGCVVRGTDARDLAVNLEVPQQPGASASYSNAHDLRVGNGHAAVLCQVLAAVQTISAKQMG
jgi:hypothetical protein